MEIQPGKPLLVCVGGNACRLGSSFGIGNIVLVDTDRRTAKISGSKPHLLVGQDIVKGEGSGGNINMARACFRTDMERLGAIILKRPLVIFLADVSGASSVAGAVEMNSLLIRVGLPSIVFLITGGEGRVEFKNSDLMAKALLDGPLRPGVDVSTGEQDDDPSVTSINDLKETISDLMMVSSGDVDVPLPAASWLLMRENGGPFGIKKDTITPSDPDPVGSLGIRPPSIAAIKVPAGTTTGEINSVLSSIFPDMVSISIGMITRPDGGGPWKISAISPVIKDDPGSMDQGVQKRGPTFEELMGSVDGFKIIPGTDL